ncbi:MAG: ATP-binding protein [Clostridia bacterium]|nr:ATP-binding protein [Clostridia bacterium]
MGYNKENYIRIRQEYADKNLRAKEAAEQRTRELHALYPELVKIDNVLRETGMNILRESMRGREGLDERIAKLRESNRELQAIRAQYLESIGYPADYTSVKYECEKCRDTGFDGAKMCECLRRDLVLAGYESSGIGKLMRTQSFETFRLDYYNRSPEERRTMERVLGICRGYAERFDAKKGDNLLFCGTTGLGKTHLSTSIAKVVIERGFDVVYDTAQNILSDFEYERFSKSYGDSSEPKTVKYFDCDLLIIDDLGTEMNNQFTVSCLYNIINTRINQSKAMLISTNLTQNEIRERYSDRITSRLFGDFIALRFFGKDIRLQKALGD